MAKQPLTTAGVTAKLSELFGMDQNSLNIESIEVANNFRPWIQGNFDLSSIEQDYLNTASDDFLRLLSSILFVSVRNRIPINFTKSVVITAAKRFETQAKFDFKYDWGGAVNRNTLLKLDIIYI